MDSQRIKLLIGLGTSIISVIVSYAIYRAFFESKDEDVKPKETRNSNTLKTEHETVLDDHGNEAAIIQISPPVQFKSSSDSQQLVAKAHETLLKPVKSRVSTDSSDAPKESEPVEEIVVPSSVNHVSSTPLSFTERALTTLKSDVVDVEDSDIIELNLLSDSDIVELLDQPVLESVVDDSLPSTASHDSDIIEIPIVCETAKSVEIESQSSIQVKATIEDSVVPASCVVLESVVNPSIKENNVGSVKVEPDSLTDHNGEVTEGKVAPSIDISESSDDSLNGCPSITTDSGIGITSTATVDRLTPLSSEAVLALSTESAHEAKHDTDVIAKTRSTCSIQPDMASTVGVVDLKATNEKCSSTTTREANEKVNGTSAGNEIAVLKQNGDSVADESNKKFTHTFLMPESLCGLFIGKGGRNVSALKHQTNTNIRVGRDPVLSTFRYCTVEGNEKNVKKALRFIKKQYPEVDTASVGELVLPPPVSHPSLSLSNMMQLHLPMGVLLDVGISHIVDAGHIFVQQPTHPAFNSWQILDESMNKCYTEGPPAPPLPHSVEDSILCVAPMNGHWHRAQIMSFNETRESCEIKLMDAGGYANVETHLLRQIRGDFLSLPFQAIECYLANMEPLDGQSYSPEAGEALRSLTCNQVVQCQAIAVAENNVPYIHIICMQNQMPVVVNQELANRGLVKCYAPSE